MSEIKDRLAELRKKYDYSQSALASEVGVSKSTIAMWEAGERIPRKQYMEAIADTFNVDMDYLYGRTDIPRKVIFDEFGNQYNNNEPFNDTEKKCIELFGELNNEQQELILNMMKNMKRG